MTNEDEEICLFVIDCNWFLTQSTYNADTNSMPVVLADVNDDNKPDIATVNQNSNDMSVLFHR